MRIIALLTWMVDYLPSSYAMKIPLCHRGLAIRPCSARRFTFTKCARQKTPQERAKFD
jgi:hypothetical protein